MNYKIGLDIRLLNRNKVTGIERYTYNLVSEMINFQSAEFNLFGEFEEPIFNNNNVKQINLELSESRHDHAKKLISLKGFTEGLDLFFSPYFPIPERRTFKGILTIHDLIPLRYPELFVNERVFDYFNEELRDNIKKVDHIIAVSDSTKKDIIDFYDVPESKISVTHLGVNKFFLDELKKINYQAVTDVLNKLKIVEPFILSVCTLEPRKNLSRVLKAFELVQERTRESLQLVLVGSVGWKIDTLFEEIKNSKYMENIVLTGFISDQELSILFSKTQLFIYPSLYEGFGLPVLEAMAHGAPVLTSNVSSLPEVGGDAVLYCDPYSIEEMAVNIEKVIFSRELNEELRGKGKVRAKRFTWKNTAEKTMGVFEKVINER